MSGPSSVKGSRESNLFSKPFSAYLYRVPWAQIVKVSGGAYFSALLGLLTVPVLARFLSPSGMGEYALCLACYFLASAVTDAGLTPYMAARAATNSEPSKVLTRTFFRFRLVLAISTLLIATFVVLQTALQTALIVAVAAGAISSLDQAWLLQGNRQFGWLASVDIVGRLNTLLWTLFLMPQHPSVGTAVLGLLVGALTRSTLSWMSARPSNSVALSSGLGTWELLRLASSTLTSRVLLLLTNYLTPIVFSISASTYSLGIFLAADKVVRALQVGLDAYALFGLPQLSTAQADRFWSRLIKIAAGGLSISLFVGIGVWIFSDQIVALIFGSTYLEAAAALRIFVLILPASVLTNLFRAAVFPSLGFGNAQLPALVVGGLSVLAMATILKPSSAEGLVAVLVCVEVLMLIVAVCTCWRIAGKASTRSSML